MSTSSHPVTLPVDAPPTVVALPRADSMADVAERLMAEFEGSQSLNVIMEIVRDCLRDLPAVPLAALPARVEALARERLRGAAPAVSAACA
jgi:hypothetical protein